MVSAGIVTRRRATPAPGKTRILFVCVGNSCRSQMAEAFARAYGSDVLAPASAGLMPAGGIAPLTHEVLAEKNITADGQFPKSLGFFAREQFDVMVNMSGLAVPEMAPRCMEWTVEDPIGQKPEVYRAVANQIENLVMQLILNLRASRQPA